MTHWKWFNQHIFTSFSESIMFTLIYLMKRRTINYFTELWVDSWTFFRDISSSLRSSFFYFLLKHSMKRKIFQGYCTYNSTHFTAGEDPIYRRRIRQTPDDRWALKTCRHVNSRDGIKPWNEADDQFQFRATSKSVNAAALTGMLGVRDTGCGI